MNVHKARNRRRTIARLAAVVVAGTAVGVVGAYAVAADDPSPARPAADLQAERDRIADWARDNNVAGLSPASLSPVKSSEQADDDLASQLEQIAEWANREGLAGLSPASLSPVGD